MLEKAQKNIQTASNQIDEVMGKRTRAIQRKLKSVETIGTIDAENLLPAMQVDDFDEEDALEE
jgi:DNA recombination protein RmuC